MDENINLAGKIEKLIVDGQREVIERLIKLSEGQEELRSGQDELRGGQEKLRQEFKTMYSELKKEIVVTGVAVQETVKTEIERVGKKLDEHMRQPAHA